MASADGNAAPPSDRMDTAPSLCAKGCGFFGNASTGNMCSKCYKETIAAGAAAAPPSSAPAVPAPVSAPAVSAPAPTPVPAAKEEPVPPPAVVAPPVAPAAVVTAPAVAKEEATEAASASSAAASSEPAPAIVPASSAQVRPAEGDAPDEPPPRKVQVKTNRCWTCNRKIGLTGFQCKCEYFFCAEHRAENKHGCDFDYKAQGKQLLSKANPTIAPSKMETI